MADTRQISEEETTLDQLNEKSALANSDLFLTRDNANQDYKVEFETVKNTLIGGAVAADNNKAPTGSTVNSAINGALANYQRVYTLTRGETNNPTLKITDTGNTRPTSILIYGYNGLNIIQFTTSVETGSIKTIYGVQLVDYNTETHEITVSQLNRQVTILLPENKKVVSQTN